MILFEINPERASVAPLEGDAPRAVDMDRIAPRPRAPQRVEVKTGLIERFKASRFVDCIQTDESAVVQIRSHTGTLAGLKQFPQPTVPKTLDHQMVM